MNKNYKWINTAKIKPYITIHNKRIDAYRIYQGKQIVEDYLFGWRNALTHARKYVSNLFEIVPKVEILNLFTGEIITLDEAEKRVKAYDARGQHIDHIK